MNLSIRPRRLRGSQILRNMVRETFVSRDQLVQPIFIVHGKNVKEPISSMPGQFRFSLDTVGREVREIWNAGIKTVILFGIPDKKDEKASGAYDKHGIVQQAIAVIKEAVPEMYVVTDVCLCEYMSHGHCGVIESKGLGVFESVGPRVSRLLDSQTPRPLDSKTLRHVSINNDATLELLAKTALSHVASGADMVAPSDMMDGRVAAIRSLLDNQGYENSPIMSYSAKYSSAFYGPFREAAESAPEFGDRKTYQMDPPNVREAIKEIKLDVAEGADIVMVKPALAYLDVIAKARKEVNVPVAAYNVSGEYSMIKAAAANGWIDETKVVHEVLTSIRRAGADIIITYFAKEFAHMF